MHEIFFYVNHKGQSPVKDYIVKLYGTSKHKRINSSKINDYIELLKKYGLNAGEPFIKHLEDNIWEIRPLRHRILFAEFKKNNFVLLHCFFKKSQKTPKREIKKAINNLHDFIRSLENE